MGLDELLEEKTTAPPKKPPCRVCHDFKTWRVDEAKKTHTVSQSAGPVSSAAPRGDSGAANSKDHLPSAASASASASPQSSPGQSGNPSAPYTPFPCPPDAGELGRSTWTFLHTMAAYYPEAPTQDEQTNMSQFLNSFSRVYPCGYCAEHLQAEIKKHPPPVASNLILSKWLCVVHNKVNKSQGKPMFDCSRVLERWRDGSEGVDC
ncbi:ERV/ALR sulfhydryl oxidase domain-containing protein [Polychytrium aggregatum]|uniref:ERV/ALR sulfhydryl oxidase domain-containing protein n=1 Tax=Polychytrium aggregatum TaxID=110093 RepID=UPI0022FE3CDB|nr:ERV/ALR sulfhydryl oxidase domain-containing protein [Polychytrium aggregatum]KAI9206247.1 ERV/ALR sulfhydryl oxidase domain-containing protein [Polychytrium aggregatum]